MGASLRPTTSNREDVVQHTHGCCRSPKPPEDRPFSHAMANPPPPKASSSRGPHRRRYTSDSKNRLCPPKVRRACRFPHCSHRGTVLRSTPKSSATSPVVKSRSGSFVKIDTFAYLSC